MINWEKFWQNEGRNEIDKKLVKFQKLISKDIIKIIDKNNYSKILDFGCGPGIIIKILAKKYPKKYFYGWDISSYIINTNKNQKFNNLIFSVKNLSKINSNKKFDLIICLSTLHYFKNPVNKIKELLELLNDKGSLIFNYPNKELLTEIKKDKDKIDYWKNRFKLMFNKKNFISLKDIKKLGYTFKIIREGKKSNKYIQIINKNFFL